MTSSYQDYNALLRQPWLLSLGWQALDGLAADVVAEVAR
jgi:hypothetical protein